MVRTPRATPPEILCRSSWAAATTPAEVTCSRSTRSLGATLATAGGCCALTRKTENCRPTPSTIRCRCRRAGRNPTVYDPNADAIEAALMGLGAVCHSYDPWPSPNTISPILDWPSEPEDFAGYLQLLESLISEAALARSHEWFYNYNGTDPTAAALGQAVDVALPAEYRDPASQLLTAVQGMVRLATPFLTQARARTRRDSMGISSTQTRSPSSRHRMRVSISPAVSSTSAYPGRELRNRREIRLSTVIFRIQALG